MKPTSLSLALVALAASAGALGCNGSSSDANQLVVTRQTSYDPSSLAAEGNTQHHFKDPNTGENGITDPAVVHADDQAIGSPEVVARLHACSKIPVATLASILSTRGVNLQDMGQNGVDTAGSLYANGLSSLGAANYAGRVPEMINASTSAMAKMFDIYVAAAPEILANVGTSTACPGVAIADAQGNFSKEGISCLMGKPASDNHVTLANQIVAAAPDVTTGEKLAIASILAAAHTCE
jgi:hypothetical protein